MHMKARGVVVGCVTAAAMSGAVAYGQQVFSNGVDVAGTYVVGNGMITLQSTTNTQGDAATRDIAPSVGQMVGINPNTGNTIVLDGDLLQLKPSQLILTNAANRVFVIAANQITNGTAIAITYAGKRIVVGVANGSIGTTQLTDGGVTSAKLGAGAVGTTQLASASVTSAKIATGAVGTTQLAASAVGATQLASGAVTSAKIATSAVGTTQLATNTVGTSQLKQPEVDNRYVNVTGDTITGPITVDLSTEISGLVVDTTGTAYSDEYQVLAKGSPWQYVDMGFTDGTGRTWSIGKDPGYFQDSFSLWYSKGQDWYRPLIAFTNNMVYIGDIGFGGGTVTGSGGLCVYGWTVLQGPIYAQDNTISYLADPVNVQDAVNKRSMLSAIATSLSNLQPVGDIGMGCYTNHP